MNFKQIDIIQCRDIVRNIDNKVSKTLINLILDGCHGNLLNEFRHKFLKVTRLSFSTVESQKLQITSKTRGMYEVFPKLASLIIRYTKASDWAYLDGQFPKLNSLDVEFQYIKEKDNFDETNLAYFLKLNPNTSRLRLQNVDLNCLKKITEASSTIDYLELDLLTDASQDYKGNNIYMDSVKELAFDSYFVKGVPKKIFFNHLIKFSFDITPTLTDNWLEFFDKNINKRLKILTLFTNTLTIEQFLKIPDKLPHLIQLDFECASEFTANGIKQFLKKFKFLKSVDMNIQINKSEQTALTEILPDEWNVDFSPNPLQNRVRVSIDR